MPSKSTFRATKNKAGTAGKALQPVRRSTRVRNIGGVKYPPLPMGSPYWEPLIGLEVIQKHDLEKVFSSQIGIDFTFDLNKIFDGLEDPFLSAGQ
jgi:hypothetical protein